VNENLSAIFSSYYILAFFLIPNLGLLNRFNYKSQHFSLNIKDSTEIKPFGALSLTDPIQEQFGFGNIADIGIVTVSRTRLLRSFKKLIFP